MKTILRQSTRSRVFGGPLKVKITGRLKTRLRGSPDDIEEDCFRLLEDGFIRLLEDGGFRLLEGCDEVVTGTDNDLDATLDFTL